MKVEKWKLEELIEKLQDCVDQMDDYEVDSVSTSCNSYGMYNFICFGSNGYLNIDQPIEVSTDEEC